jgi:hypothetical protein
MKLDSRIPEPVQPVIKNYLRLTEQRLVGLINASYIVGAIALGEFNEHFSDIDFITVLSGKLSPIVLDSVEWWKQCDFLSMSSTGVIAN